MSSSHSADELEIFLKGKLSEFKVWERIFFFTVDNASIMRKCCKNMKKDFTGCFSYLLHLDINRFLDITTLKKSIAAQESIDSDSNDDLDCDDNLNTDDLDELFEEEESVNILFPDEAYESKEYTADELKCLELIRSVIKKIKQVVSGFNQSNYLTEELLTNQEESDNPVTFA